MKHDCIQGKWVTTKKINVPSALMLICIIYFISISFRVIFEVFVFDKGFQPIGLLTQLITTVICVFGFMEDTISEPTKKWVPLNYKEDEDCPKYYKGEK